MGDYTLGVDVSHWQGAVDWLKMRAKGVKWAITKATDFYRAQPIGFVDTRADENFKGMRNVGMLAGGYCWLQPKVDPKLQARFYLDNFYYKYKPDFPPVVDFEDVAVNSWGDYLWRLQEWLRIVEGETKRKPIVYTANWFMNFYTDKSKLGFLVDYPLWVAHYIARSYPTVPKPWSKWTIWQYSDRGNYPSYVYGSTTGYGRDWGTSSAYLDMNWFNGTYTDLFNFLQLGDSTPIVPPPPAPEPKPIFYARCKVYSLNVRSGAGTAYPVVGYLKSGDIVPVYEDKAGWYRFDTNKWSSGYYMEKVVEQSETNPVLFKAKCIVSALNKRSGPDLTYAKVGYLVLGNIVNVYEVKNNWYRIEPNSQVWVSGYSQYMQRV